MVDWYKCSSTHSQPLNANLKAYAAWWLWARLVGWTRVDAKQHYVEDVWAGVAIGIVNNLIFTKRYQDKKVVVARISPSFLSHVERGTKKASLMTIKRIANALEVPIPNLFYPPKEPVVYLKSDQDLFTRLKSPLWAGQKVVVFKV